MTKQEAIKRLEEVKQEQAELEEIINKPERWQDELVQFDNESYYFLTGNASTGFEIIHSNYGWMEPEYAFRTAEQAELMAEKCKLIIEMHQFANVRNDGWEADWEDENEQRKYGIIYPVNNVRVDGAVGTNYFVFGISVKSEEIAEEMLSIFEERIEAIYNKQY